MMNNIISNNNSNITNTGDRLREIEIEIFTIGEQVQNNFIAIGQKIDEAKSIIEKGELKDSNGNTITYNQWCEKNIGMHPTNCNRFIRIAKIYSKNEDLKSLTSGLGFMDGRNSFRKLDAIAMLAEEIKDEEGNKDYNVDEIVRFLKDDKNKDILDKSLSTIRDEVLKEREDKIDYEKLLEEEKWKKKVTEDALAKREEKIKELENKLGTTKEENKKLIQEFDLKVEQKTGEVIQAVTKSLEYEYNQKFLRRKEGIELEKRKLIAEKEELKKQYNALELSKDEIEKNKKELEALEEKIKSYDKDIVALSEGADRITKIKEVMEQLNNVTSALNEINKPQYTEYFENENINVWIKPIVESFSYSINELEGKLKGNNFKYSNVVDVDLYK